MFLTFNTQLIDTVIKRIQNRNMYRDIKCLGTAIVLHQRIGWTRNQTFN